MVGSPRPGDVVSLDARHLLIDRRVVGTVGGGNVPQRDIPRIMELVRAGRLDLAKLVSQRLPLERVQEAFTALEEGKLARSVVVL
jgi:Zn-dependent alcohol dehydrogenase